MAENEKQEKGNDGSPVEIERLVSEHYPVKKKKYKQGDLIKTLPEAIAMIEERKPFYWRHKFMAAGFIEHWSIVQIRNAVKYKMLKIAVAC